MLSLVLEPRVLVIDDEASVLRVFAGVLKAHGCQMLSSTSGAEGLELLRSQRPDVVFTDIRLEGMDGLDFLERAREIAPEVPVVLVTGYADRDRLVRAVQLSAFDLIDKPFELEAVRVVLQRALSQRRLLIERGRAEAQTGRLERLARKINVARSLEDMFACLQAELAPALGVRLFSVFLWDEAARRLRLASTNHVPEPVGMELALEEADGPMRDAVLQREAIIIPDFALSPYAGAGPVPRRDRYIQKASATIPLLVRGALVGLLNVNDKLEPPESFDATDAAFLAIAAEHLASAIAVRQEAAELARTVAELERTQLSLIQAEKLAAVSKLVAGVAHEIKNPLTSLQFATANLSDELSRYAVAGVDTHRGRRFLATMVEDITRVRDRVDGLMGVARPERTPRTLCDPGEVVALAAAQVLTRCEASNTRLVVQRAAPLPRVNVDRQAFTQAVVNLIVNALEAIGRGGRIDVSVSAAYGWVRVEVKDTGPGIPEQVAAHMFDLFFTTKPRGSGIGLSQVHVFCDTHGGHVSFDSSPQGARFTIELAAASGPAAPAEEG